MALFSRRNVPVPDVYGYDIPETTRNRVLATFKVEYERDGRLSFGDLLGELNTMIFQSYGYFCKAPHGSTYGKIDPALEHFFYCKDEEVMDFLVMCFETRWCGGGQSVVEAVNRVLEEDNVGYELSSFSNPELSPAGFTPYSIFAVHSVIRPKAIKKNEKHIHRAVIQPALHALCDARFANASTELLNAFEEYRKGKFGDAITDAGASIESVLKTICTHKKWTFDKDKHTCSKLLDICRAEGLFHPFYKPILEATATIRNKVGDAHGKGPAPDLQRRNWLTICWPPSAGTLAC